MKKNKILVVGAFVLFTCIAPCFYGIYSAADWAYYLGKEKVHPSTKLTKLNVLGDVSSVAFSNDSTLLVAGAFSMHKWEGKHSHGELRIWNLTTNKEVHHESFEMPVRSISLHPLGKEILVAHSNLDNGQPVFGKPGQFVILEFPTLRLVHKSV